MNNNKINLNEAQQFAGKEIYVVEKEEKHLKKVFKQLEEDEDIIKKEEHEIKQLNHLFNKIQTSLKSINNNFMYVKAYGNDKTKTVKNNIESIAIAFVKAQDEIATANKIYKLLVEMLNKETEVERRDLRLFQAIKEETKLVTETFTMYSKAMLGDVSITKGREQFIEAFKEKNQS